MSDILTGMKPSSKSGNQEFRKQRAARHQNDSVDNDLEFNMNWLPQKRQHKFLKACGLSHPFSYYLDLKDNGKPKIFRIPPEKRQTEYQPPEARIVGYGGAAGSGKSDSMLIGLFVEVLSNPGAKCGYFRRKYSQLEGAGGAIMRSKELFSDFPGAKWNGKNRRWTFESLNGGIIEFCHANNEDDVYNYQSQQFDAVAFDEATQFTRFQYRYIMSRNRVTVKGVSPLVMMGTNPGGVGHRWFKKEFIDIGDFEKPHEVEVAPGAKEKHMFIPAKLSDNIILNDRDEGYKDNLMGLGEVEKRRLLFGDWDIHAGQFFPKFDRNIHVMDSFDIPDYWRRFISIDYGLDMSAVYWYALDNEGFYYVYKELYRPNLSLSDLAVAIHEKTTPIERDVLSYTVASPDLWNRRQETGKSGRQILAENGLSGYALRKADDRRVEGWRVVREYLKPFDDPMHDGEGEPKKVARVRIFGDRVRKLQSHLPALQHDDDNPDDVSDTPHDITHAPESFRYFCMSRPPLRSLTPADEKESKRRRSEIMAGKNKYTGY